MNLNSSIKMILCVLNQSNLDKIKILAIYISTLAKSKLFQFYTSTSATRMLVEITWSPKPRTFQISDTIRGSKVRDSRVETLSGWRSLNLSRATSGWSLLFCSWIWETTMANGSNSLIRYATHTACNISLHKWCLN